MIRNHFADDTSDCDTSLCDSRSITEKTPILSKTQTKAETEAQKSAAAELRDAIVTVQIRLIVGACSMACGWTFGDVLLEIFNRYFNEIRAFPNNPVLCTLGILGIVIIFAETYGYFKPRLHAKVCIVIQLWFHSLGVMLGRATHYCFTAFLQPATLGTTGWPVTVIYLLWAILFTIISMFVSALYSWICTTSQQYAEVLHALTKLSTQSFKTYSDSNWSTSVPSLTRRSRLVSMLTAAKNYSAFRLCHSGVLCTHIMRGEASFIVLLKIIAMIVAWSWSDLVKNVSTEWFGDVDGKNDGWKALFSVIYSLLVTLVAAWAAYLIEHMGPVSTAAFGLATGFAWKQAIHGATVEYQWEDVLYIEIIFAITITAISTLAVYFLLPFTAAVQQQELDELQRLGIAGPRPVVPGMTGLSFGEKPPNKVLSALSAFRTNCVTLLSIAFGLNVGWSWGAVLDSVIKKNLENSINDQIIAVTGELLCFGNCHCDNSSVHPR